ncbi:MAG: response regulator [Synechococcaceae cyanobacterium SM2_3_1]|nr:response regulator [Synechococcaceae cyanobacterium SM2_3_1]
MPYTPGSQSEAERKSRNLAIASVMVVDDNTQNLRLLAQLLVNQNYRVRSVTSGSMALKSIRADPPDLILLDINMPQMSGYEVCTQLKAETTTAEIPIIFISALDKALDKVKAFQVGGADYITKPFQLEEVLARVEHQLTIRRLQLHLRQEQQKSEQLLRAILPEAIVDRLKQAQPSSSDLTAPLLAEYYEEVTILFADIVDFTPLAAQLSPLQVVQLLNQIFANFDRLAHQYGLQKIKTIGDAYMLVGGLPVPRSDHVEAVAEMALAMQEQIRHYPEVTYESLQLRVGMHTGAVVAGVIGIDKFSYDLWGDAVNLASRMESQGKAGQIQVSVAVYNRLCHTYRLQQRGLIPVKGKGLVTTYWLLGKK